MAKMARMSRMSKLSEMSEDYIRATRRATIRPVSEMADMPNMTARHVMRGLGKVAV
jgi:hypothetical protein